jgi:hypothetical protein
MHIRPLIISGIVLLNIVPSAAWADSNTGSKVACTAEAKLCPDGSAVGRSGPNCEFAPCPGHVPAPSKPDIPAPSSRQGIIGIVTLGPRCPVERVPEPDNCKDKPYMASLVATSQDASSSPFYFYSDADGKFRVDLPAGTYAIASQDTGLPICKGSAIVMPGKFTVIKVACDTGIR